MKKQLIILGALLALACQNAQAQIGFGTTAPDDKSIVDIKSSEKGLLIPRLDAAQVGTLQGALTATQNGMMVYNTTEKCMQVFVDTKFECLGAGAGEWADSTGYIVAADALANGDTVVVTDDGKIGVGTSTPDALAQLHIASEGADTRLLLGTYGNAISTEPQVRFERARGTMAAPAALEEGDIMALLSFNGYNGTAFTSFPTASLAALATEDWTPTANGTRLLFNITPNGTTANTIAMSIENDGNVGIGTNDPQERLHVDAANDSLQFENLAGTGNGLAIDAAGKVYRANIATTDSAEWTDQGDYILARRAGAAGDTVVITDAGHIGIGTTAPINKLVIDNTSGGTDGVRIASPTAAIWLESKDPNGELWSLLSLADGWSNPDGAFVIKQGSTNSDRFTILNNGNVGIGATAPLERLHVDAANDSLQIDNLNGTGNVLAINADGKVYKAGGTHSTTEAATINTWHNSKVIYRRVITAHNLAAASATFDLSGTFGADDIEIITSIKVINTGTNGVTSSMLSYNTNTNSMVMGMGNLSSVHPIGNYDIVIEYTKQ